MRRPYGFWNQPAEVLARDFSNEKFGDTLNYITVTRDGKRVTLHAWLYEKLVGPIPDGYCIDHRNGKPFDNRLENLRACTPKVNMMNKKKYSSNKSGETGVRFDKARGKWKAEIGSRETAKFLGRFDLFDDAVRARKRAQEDLGFTSRHGTSPNNDQ